MTGRLDALLFGPEADGRPTDHDEVQGTDGRGDAKTTAGRDIAGRLGSRRDRGPVTPDALAVHSAGVDFSRGELAERATDIATAIAEAGGGPGVPVGVMLPDGIDLVAALFAVWRVGGVYVPLNPRLGAADLAHVLDTVDPAVIVTTPTKPHPQRDRGRGLVVIGGEIAVRATAATGGRRYDDGVALIQFTSGTTGRPKPVLLEHAGVLALIDGVLAKIRGDKAGGPRPPMPNLIPVSLSLWAGIYQVLFAFRAGNPVVVMDGFEPRTFARLVERFEIRSTVLPPAAMAMLCDDETIDGLAPLRFVRSITAPLSPLQARRFRDRFGISVLNAYGQTEIGGEIVGWNAADSRAFGETKLGSVGRPHDGVEIRIRPISPAVEPVPTRSGAAYLLPETTQRHQNEEGTATAEIPVVGEVGEIEVRTPAMSAGYADGGDLTDRLTDDGWFRTGDVGHLDDDGFLWIDGRVSDMINRGGFKVFPAEVEEVLRLDPSVADAAVVGAVDHRVGEVPVAFVVGAEGHRIDAAALAAHCRHHLAPYKVPTEFHGLDELPRTEAGKVRMTDLRHRLA